MWPLPPLHDNVVTITFYPQQLCCSWIKQSGKRAPLSLQAYKRYPLDNLELEQLTVFNPTHIKQCITEFLQSNTIRHAFVAFGLSGPGMKETIATVSSASPQPDDFNLRTTDLLWDFCYLYPKDHGQFAFYVYGIPRHVLFQYQLLAIATPLNLTKITPVRAALFHAYTFLYGNAFRQAQFAHDMQRVHNRIEYLFTPEKIRRIIEVPSMIDKEKELGYILEACGLFISERRNLT